MSGLKSQEHYALLEAFERQSRSLPTRLRLDREAKELWPKGNVYQDGHTNEMFLAYRLGYAQGRSVYLQSGEAA